MATGDKHSKTEKPTPKRKREAREKGQVARSPDIGGSLAALLGSFLLPWIFSRAEAGVLGISANVVNVMNYPSAAGATDAFVEALRTAFVVIVPIAACFLVLGVVSNLPQVGLHLSFKAGKPRFSRISPKEGFKRLFSPVTAVSLARQAVKLVLIGAVGYQTLNHLVHIAPSTVPIGIGQTMGIGTASLLSFIRITALVSFLIGAGDYAYQRHKLLSNLKMTKNEVKDEARQTEGDPAMKGEMRKRQYAIARSRVIAAVRTADVIVANPTHFAVALQYDTQAGKAPRVVAKGSDLLAGRIRDEAFLHRVPVVEDPPLARYLYANCKIGQSIPVEIYVAVARLLAFVYSLPESIRGIQVHYQAPSRVPSDPPIEDIERLSRRSRSQLALQR